MVIVNDEIRFSSINYNQKNKELIDKIIEMANRISETSRNGPGNWVLGNPVILNTIDGLQMSTRTRKDILQRYSNTTIKPNYYGTITIDEIT